MEIRVKRFIDSGQPVGYEPDNTGRNLLEPLDQLREATLAFGDHRKQWPLVSDMGLYQGHRVGPEVEASYLDILAYQYLPTLMFGVMGELAGAPDDSTERMARLRVLRMLYDASGRRTDIVAGYMSEFWQDRFPGRADLQQRLMDHLAYAMARTDLAALARNGDTTAEMALAPFAAVQWAQHELGRTAALSGCTAIWKRLPAASFRHRWTWLRASGPAFSAVFTRLMTMASRSGKVLRQRRPH